MSISFSQSCPTCGRRVEVRASLLGHIVACQHCRSEFVASSSESIDRLDQSDDELMLRVERAIQKADEAAPTV